MSFESGYQKSKRKMLRLSNCIPQLTASSAWGCITTATAKLLRNEQESQCCPKFPLGTLLREVDTLQCLSECGDSARLPEAFTGMTSNCLLTESASRALLCVAHPGFVRPQLQRNRF